MKAPIPPNEAERLEALRSYHVLDTLAEEAYDDITRLASYICGVPIAMISLVDGDRQWFKAKVGLKQDGTVRDAAFCAHAIVAPKPMIIKDALKDNRFAKSLLVKRPPHIRFYAGFPLITPEGHAIGTLCAIDRKPRDLSSEQKEAMEALARQVMDLLELRRASSRLVEALEHVKTLHGLLPICAWCKRIRDDKGYWAQVEAYVKEHSNVEFTHGICPECMEKQRPKAKRVAIPEHDGKSVCQDAVGDVGL
jgi:GAF domain-containing protein